MKDKIVVDPKTGCHVLELIRIIWMTWSERVDRLEVRNMEM